MVGEGSNYSSLSKRITDLPNKDKFDFNTFSIHFKSCGYKYKICESALGDFHALCGPFVVTSTTFTTAPLGNLQPLYSGALPFTSIEESIIKAIAVSDLFIAEAMSSLDCLAHSLVILYGVKPEHFPKNKKIYITNLPSIFSHASLGKEISTFISKEIHFKEESAITKEMEYHFGPNPSWYDVLRELRKYAMHKSLVVNDVSLRLNITSGAFPRLEFKSPFPRFTKDVSLLYEFENIFSGLGAAISTICGLASSDVKVAKQLPLY